MNQQTYKEFKRWFVDTCVTKTNGHTVYSGCVAHAIASAWHIYRHGMDMDAADDYLLLDALKSSKTFTHYGYRLDFDSYTMRNVEPSVYNAGYVRIGKELTDLLWKRYNDFESGGHSAAYYYCSEYVDDASLECRESWRLAVTAIVEYWRAREFMVEGVHSQAAFYRYVMCSDDPDRYTLNSHLKDEMNLLWHVLKHNMCEEDARAWFRDAIEKRDSKIRSQYFNPCLRIDAYPFRHVLNVSNEMFEVKTWERHMQKFKERTIEWVNVGKPIEIHSYKLKGKYHRENDGRRQTTDYVPFDVLARRKDGYAGKLTGRGLLIRPEKKCTQDGFVDEVHIVKGPFKTERFSLTPSEPESVEPIMLTICPKPWHDGPETIDLVSEEGIRRAKECFLESLMDLWYLFKSLDDVNVETAEHISYEDFCQPIGDIKPVKLKFC